MRRRLFLGLLGFATLCAGCAAIRANAARESAIQGELDRYVIPKPLPEVWSAVGSADTETDKLLWQGYAFTWKDTGTYRKQTDKKTNIEPGSGDKQRTTRWFECEGESVPGGSRVRYFEAVQTTTIREGVEIGTDMRRDRRTDIELDLIRRFDPTGADRIEASGDRAARAERAR